ncbi:MAG: LysM peptidoglycan-binding domain-containing protein, partial [Paracoccaceae bacterium]|nr:LysM peptidoglycan-binding domain-containing protein [Paracoccaceae bacterium]
MTIRFTQLRRLGLTTALAALTACAPSEFDWDLRRNPNALNTSDAALNATQARPQADARGVLSYPGYQVAVAQRGDTVASVAARVGVDTGELARFNALQPGNAVRAGEVLALPRRVAGGVPTSAGTTTGAVIGSPIQTGPIDVTTLAGGAIDRASTTTGQPGNAAASAEPARHRVTRGETAFGIARSYNVSPRALADWNGLDAN